MTSTHYLCHLPPSCGGSVRHGTFNTKPKSKSRKGENRSRNLLANMTRHRFQSTPIEERQEGQPRSLPNADDRYTIEKYNDMLYDKKSSVNKVLSGVVGAFDVVSDFIYSPAEDENSTLESRNDVEEIRKRKEGRTSKRGKKESFSKKRSSKDNHAFDKLTVPQKHTLLIHGRESKRKAGIPKLPTYREGRSSQRETMVADNTSERRHAAFDKMSPAIRRYVESFKFGGGGTIKNEDKTSPLDDLLNDKNAKLLTPPLPHQPETRVSRKVIMERGGFTEEPTPQQMEDLLNLIDKKVLERMGSDMSVQARRESPPKTHNKLTKTDAKMKLTSIRSDLHALQEQRFSRHSILTESSPVVPEQTLTDDTIVPDLIVKKTSTVSSAPITVDKYISPEHPIRPETHSIGFGSNTSRTSRKKIELSAFTAFPRNSKVLPTTSATGLHLPVEDWKQTTMIRTEQESEINAQNQELILGNGSMDSPLIVPAETVPNIPVAPPAAVVAPATPTVYNVPADYDSSKKDDDYDKIGPMQQQPNASVRVQSSTTKRGTRQRTTFSSDPPSILRGLTPEQWRAVEGLMRDGDDIDEVEYPLDDDDDYFYGDDARHISIENRVDNEPNKSDARNDNGMEKPPRPVFRARTQPFSRRISTESTRDTTSSDLLNKLHDSAAKTIQRLREERLSKQSEVGKKQVKVVDEKDERSFEEMISRIRHPPKQQSSQEEQLGRHSDELRYSGSTSRGEDASGIHEQSASLRGHKIDQASEVAGGRSYEVSSRHQRTISKRLERIETISTQGPSEKKVHTTNRNDPADGKRVAYFQRDIPGWREVMRVRDGSDSLRSTIENTLQGVRQRVFNERSYPQTPRVSNGGSSCAALKPKQKHRVKPNLTKAEMKSDGTKMIKPSPVRAKTVENSNVKWNKPVSGVIGGDGKFLHDSTRAVQGRRNFRSIAKNKVTSGVQQTSRSGFHVVSEGRSDESSDYAVYQGGHNNEVRTPPQIVFTTVSDTRTIRQRLDALRS